MTAILWLIISSLVFIQFVDLLDELRMNEKIFICLIILIGGPIIVAYQLIESIFDNFLPEGWNDDDGRPPGK